MVPEERKEPSVYKLIVAGPEERVVGIHILGLGSDEVMQGFGVAVKLTLAGNNQFTLVSTYVFGITVAGCILVQMNYFNKALDTFSTNVYVPPSPLSPPFGIPSPR